MARQPRTSDLDRFQRPSGQPWLLLVVLLAATAVVVWKQRPGSPRADAERPAPPPAAAGTPAAAVTEAAAPAAAAPAVETAVADRPTPSQPPAPPAPAAPPPSAAPAPPTPARTDGPNVLAKAKEAEQTGKLLAARNLYLYALKAFPDGPARLEAEQRLGRVSVELLFSARPMPEKQEYVVRSGDSLDSIAAASGTTPDLIVQSNGLRDPNVIRAGTKLQVCRGKFTLAISRARNDMLVSLNGEMFKRYAVGTGKEGKTPVGTFKIVDKEKEPAWWPQGRRIPYGHPDNILGTRWMSLRATGGTPEVSGYGIHGTWDDASIGKSESAGCIRMHNKDVEELFVYVPRGTEVTIGD